jgi:RNA recognition motif-containing protein
VELMSRALRLLRCRINYDLKSGRSKGFGFIDFDGGVDVDSAIAKLQSLQISGRKVKCEIAQGSGYIPGEGFVTTDNGLFIGNIDYAVSRETLMTLVSNAIGASSIDRLLLMTDQETGHNSGHCHLFLASPKLVDSAIEKLQGLSLMGRALRVDRTRLKSASDFKKENSFAKMETYVHPVSSSCEIFIANFPLSVNEATAREILDEVVGVGSYRSVRFLVRDNGESKGFAFIEFFDDASAALAISKLDGLVIDGRKLRAEVAMSRRKRTPKRDGQNSAANLHASLRLTNIHPDLTEEQFQSMIADILGAEFVSNARLVMEPETHKCAGVAYLDFASPEDADIAVDRFQGLEVLGNEIQVHRLAERPSTEPSRAAASATSVNAVIGQPQNEGMSHEIFVHGLHPDITQEMLSSVLYQLLKCDNFQCRVIRNKENPSLNKGYAFVSFLHKEDCGRAIEELNGVELYGKPIYAKVSQQQQQEQQQPQGRNNSSRYSQGYGGRRVVAGGRGGNGPSLERSYHTVAPSYRSFEDYDFDVDFFTQLVEGEASDLENLE